MVACSIYTVTILTACYQWKPSRPTPLTFLSAVLIKCHTFDTVYCTCCLLSIQCLRVWGSLWSQLLVSAFLLDTRRILNKYLSLILSILVERETPELSIDPLYALSGGLPLNSHIFWSPVCFDFIFEVRKKKNWPWSSSKSPSDIRACSSHLGENDESVPFLLLHLRYAVCWVALHQ